MYNKKLRTQLFATAALCLAPFTVPGVQAGIISAQDDSNWVQWELTSSATPGVDTSGLFTLTATIFDDQGAASSGTKVAADEDWWLAAFSLKNFGSHAQVSITGDIIAPEGGLWDWTNEDLNAGACKSNGTDDALCIYLTDVFPGPGNYVPAALGGASANTNMTTFSFTFNVLSTEVLPENLQFKVNWREQSCRIDKSGDQVCDWVKVGGLLAKGTPYTSPPAISPLSTPDTSSVPVPGTLGLLGLGLVALRRSYTRR